MIDRTAFGFKIPAEDGITSLETFRLTKSRLWCNLVKICIGEKEKMSKRTKVLTPIFRVSFPSVFSPAKPMKNKDGSVGDKKPKFELTMVYDPATFSPEDKKRFQAMRVLVDEVAVETFKKPLKDVPGARKPFRD